LQHAFRGIPRLFDEKEGRRDQSVQVVVHQVSELVPISSAGLSPAWKKGATMLPCWLRDGELLEIKKQRPPSQAAVSFTVEVEDF
jgi:hypothetical protein